MGIERHHPDGAWVGKVIADLTAWLRSPSASPTSQITGGGAIGEAERLFSQLHDDRPCLLVPSATYGMRVALAAFGVGAGDDVLVPAIDWVSTGAAVRSLGANPVAVACDPTTETMDAAAAAAALSPRTRVVVVCHLHGEVADVAALRGAIGSGVPVIEDAAQALGLSRDGRRVGTLADAAVFSFGPGKTVDVGEAGMIVLRTERLRDVVSALVSHPLRLVREGTDPMEDAQFSMRPHPVSAIRLVARLREWAAADLTLERR